MIEAARFVDRAGARGFDFYAAVPCSFLTGLIHRIMASEALTYLSASNEGDAVAAAAGAQLGGRRAAALMQNSGLGNAVNPLTSLAWPFRIPLLLIVTWRGDPDLGDEPQHLLMGAITGRLLDAMEIGWEVLPGEEEELEAALDRADTHMRRTSRPYALIVRKGTIAAGTAEDGASGEGRARKRAPEDPRPSVIRRTRGLAPGERPTRGEVLRRVVERTDPERTVVIATTGHTGRELYAIADRPNHLYMVGSMGCASSLGLGLALARPDLRIVVLDGDGAALMRLGNLPMVGAYAGPTYLHIVLDNEMHASTGGQPTVSPGVSFAGVAAACGYERVWEADGVDLLDELLTEPDVPASADGPGGPRLLHLKIRPGSPPKLPRPELSPAAVRERLMMHIGSAAETRG